VNGPRAGGWLEERPWLLILFTLACAAVYLPLGVAVGAGSTVYAHFKGKIWVRNVLLALLIVPILVLSMFYG
jgi:ABC-type sugar transport system permease subunit